MARARLDVSLLAAISNCPLRFAPRLPRACGAWPLGPRHPNYHAGPVPAALAMSRFRRTRWRSEVHVCERRGGPSPGINKCGAMRIRIREFITTDSIHISPVANQKWDTATYYVDFTSITIQRAKACRAHLACAALKRIHRQHQHTRQGYSLNSSRASLNCSVARFLSRQIKAGL